MALATRDELVASVKAWLRRTSDPTLAERVDDLVHLCEADFADKLRTRHLLTRARATLNEQWEFLPDDCLHVQTVWLIRGGVRDPEPMDYHSPDNIARLRKKTGAVPCYYTVIGRQLGFFPANELDLSSDLQFDLIYYRRASKLLADSDSNAVLLNYPAIYLYGTLRQAAPFLRDDPAIAIWEAAYNDALSGANAETRELIGGPLTMELA